MSDQREVAEILGMRLISDTASFGWAERLQGPHPLRILVAVGALTAIATSRLQALQIAYRLDDTGLLNDLSDRIHSGHQETT